MIPQAICTLFGLGNARPGPGTWGSAAALPLAYLIHQVGGFALLVMCMCLLFALGLWATARMTHGADDHDPSEIIVDEVVGQWVALAPLSLTASMRGIDILAMWPGWLAAFVLFRVFDIWKPWLVARADARGDALGVMLDDVIAGVFAAIVMLAVAAFSHGVLMR